MAGIIDDILGYITPGGIKRRQGEEYQQALTNSQSERALELQQKSMQANAIPTLMAYDKDQARKAGWKSARNLWAAHAGRGPEATRAPSETDMLIQGLIKSLASESKVDVPENKTSDPMRMWKGTGIGTLAGGPIGTIAGTLIGGMKKS